MSYTKVSHGFVVEAKLLDNSNRELYDISHTIQSIMVKKSFLENSFPLYVFDIRCTEKQRDIMRDNDVSIRLIISYYNMDDALNSENLDSSNVTLIDKVYDGIIRIYEKPFTTTLAIKDEDVEGSDVENQSNSAPFVYYRMSGIPEELISKNETVVNNIYRDCEVADAAINLLTTIDSQSPIYFQDTTNKAVHPWILIPPVSLVPGIRFIDEYYMHFYEHPAAFFLDDTGMYLYDVLSTETPNTNIVEVRVLDSTSKTQESNARPAVDENNNIQIIYKTIPSFSKNTSITSHELGSQTIYYFYDDNFNLVTDNDSNDESYTKTRYIWERLSDRTIKTVNYDKTIMLSFSSINPALINPLTLVNISSHDYPDVSGSYGIVDFSYILSSNDGRHFTSTGSIQAIKK